MKNILLFIVRFLSFSVNASNRIIFPRLNPVLLDKAPSTRVLPHNSHGIIAPNPARINASVTHLQPF